MDLNGYQKREGGNQFNILYKKNQPLKMGDIRHKKVYKNMKHVILIILLSLPLMASAQKNLPEYQASNGITYHAGDTVKLGRGSGPTHEFLYVLTSGGISLQRGYSGGTVIIKKIHRVKFRGIDKVYFEVTPGKYLLYIEDAIAYCEIEDCKK